MVSFAKPLEVDDLPLPQEADDVVYVGIIAKTQDVIVCDAGFLFRSQILCQVGDHVTGRLHASCTPRKTRCGGGVDTSGVVHEIRGKGSIIAHLLIAEIPGELMDQSGHHFHMA